MLRILPLADDLILPQAKQEIYFFNRIGRLLPVMNDCDRPIVLKKSGLVPIDEKYASEIEILTFSRGCLTRISRSSVQKRCIHPSIFEQFGQTDFFNRIDPEQTFKS
jgi:hypothetical protein